MQTKKAVAAFTASCRARNLSPRTTEFYLWATSKLPSTLPQTTPKLESILALYQASPESRRSLHRGLRSFFNWLSDRYNVPNPATGLRAPRAGHATKARGLSMPELRRLLSLTLSRRDRALILLLIDTGIRIGEAAGLTWDNISDKTILVTGKTGPRDVPISPETRRALVGATLPWLGPRGHLRSRGLAQAVTRALRSAHIPAGGPHLLRHTFGRQWILAGGDVFSLQRIMGHANITTTRIYVEMDTRDTITQHTQFSPLKSAIAGHQMTLWAAAATHPTERKENHDD